MLQMLQMIGSGSAQKLYVDDVFSTYLYDGNGSTQTINNGNDLAKNGGLVWIKARSSADSHSLFNNLSLKTQFMASNLTNGLITGANNVIDQYNSNGFQVNQGSGLVNQSGTRYVAWTFRNAPKFHAHAVVTKSAGSNASISFPELETLGMVRVKRTDAAGSWYVWHRSLSAGQLLIGETTAAAATLGHITVSGTTITLVNGVIADGTYLVEAFAHDASAEGLIQCGSFTTDASGNATLNLGWEPQFCIFKKSSAAQSWFMYDQMRGFNLSQNAHLYPDLSAAEAAASTGVFPTATGFSMIGNPFGASQTVIYLAIRRPNKPPTTGTEVYNAIARTGTGAAATITGVGFAPDVVNTNSRNGLTLWSMIDRLRGIPKHLSTNSTDSESNNPDGILSFGMDGASTGADSWVNYSGRPYINHFFRRAAGFYDIVCYNGTGSNKTEPHTLLGVAPELWRAKRRNGVGSWVYGSSLLNANEKIVMPSPNGRVTDATAWNSTYPTATQISLGTHTDVNAAGGTYIIEMWATLAGVSKVGAYTGNGSSQTIDCGFGTGARFIKIIRMTAGVAQDVYIWDTARGIVAANDPHLSLNTAAAEVTTDDSVDPAGVGFIVNQNAATNINVTGASYLFLAIA